MATARTLMVELAQVGLCASGDGDVPVSGGS
jgi:hypothetical protein